MDRHQTSGYWLISDGILTLVAGVALLFLTWISQATLVYFFAGFAVVYGISQIVASRGEIELDQNPIYMWAIGVYSVLAGLGLLFFRDASLSLLIGLVAIYAILMGVAEAAASYLYQEMHGSNWLVAEGILQAIFGLLLLAFTGIALETFIAAVASYAIVVGGLTTMYGYILRESAHKPHAKML